MVDWDLIKITAQCLVVPVIGWLLKKIFEIERKQSEQEVKLAVVESKVDDMREDIKEIKHNVERLLDRR